MAASYYSVAETAKMLRAALKQRFPGQVFSVRSKSYSGGASIDVSWTDGPLASDVESVTHLYTGASFDGMIDLKSYHSQIVMSEGELKEVHFGADYIFCHRAHSVGFLARVYAKVCERYGVPARPDAIRVSAYSGHGELTNDAAFDLLHPESTWCHKQVRDAVWEMSAKMQILANGCVVTMKAGQ